MNIKDFILNIGSNPRRLRVVIITICIIAAYILVLSRFINMDNDLKNQVRKAKEEMRSLLISEKLPTEELFNQFLAEVQKIQDNYKALLGVFRSKDFMYRAPQVDGLYFRERLYAVSKQIFSQIQDKNIKLEENLGFGNSLPSEQDAPFYLLQLDMIDNIFNLLLKAGIADVVLIRPLDIERKLTQDNTEILFTELPVQCKIYADMEQFTKFMYEVQKLYPLIIDRELYIRPTKDLTGTLEINIIFSSIAIEDPTNL